MKNLNLILMTAMTFFASQGRCDSAVSVQSQCQESQSLQAFEPAAASKFYQALTPFLLKQGITLAATEVDAQIFILSNEVRFKTADQTELSFSIQVGLSQQDREDLANFEKGIYRFSRPGTRGQMLASALAQMSLSAGGLTIAQKTYSPEGSLLGCQVVLGKIQDDVKQDEIGLLTNSDIINTKTGVVVLPQELVHIHDVVIESFGDIGLTGGTAR